MAATMSQKGWRQLRQTEAEGHQGQKRHRPQQPHQGHAVRRQLGEIPLGQNVGAGISQGRTQT